MAVKQVLTKWAVYATVALHGALGFVGAVALGALRNAASSDSRGNFFLLLTASSLAQLPTVIALARRHVRLADWLGGLLLVLAAGLVYKSVPPQAWLPALLILAWSAGLLYGVPACRSLFHFASFGAFVAGGIGFWAFFSSGSVSQVLPSVAYAIVSLGLGIWIAARGAPKRFAPATPGEMSAKDAVHLCRCGRYGELFGLHPPWSLFQLAEAYGQFLGRFNGNSEARQAIDRAHQVLNSPRSSALHEKCRSIMEGIQKDLEERKFRRCEPEIWSELWKEMEHEFGGNPDAIMNDIKQSKIRKYVQKCRRR